MLNLIIFVVSVGLVFAVWCAYRKDQDEQTSTKQHVIVLLVISLLFLPLNINGNIYTILGSGNAENNFNSVFSFYQDAKNGKANQVIGVGLQFAKKKTFTGLGIVYQNSQENSEAGIGISWQESKKARAIIGISLFQKGDSLLTGLGISCYQNSKSESCCFLGISLFQKSKKTAITVGLNGFQQGDNSAGTLGINGFQSGGEVTTVGFNGFQSGDTTRIIGLNLYSKANHIQDNSAGITLLTNVAGNIRSFSAFSKNKAEK